ncbi:MAG: DUF4012 domain-containing protein [Parcubacteria group bacterium]
MFHRHQNFLSTPKIIDQNQWQRVFLFCRQYFWRGLAILLVLIVVSGILAGLSLVPYLSTLGRVYAAGLAGKNQLVAAESSLRAQKFTDAAAQLDSAEKSFALAGTELKSADRAFLFKIGLAKNQLTVAEDILFIGEKTSHALSGLAGVGQELANVLGKGNTTFKDITPAQKIQLLAVIVKNTDELDAAQQAFKNVADSLDEINRLHPLFIFNGLIAPLRTEIPKIQQTFDSALTAVKWLPVFAGFPQGKTFLIILENNRELRPAGGFIGTYGLLSVKNGEITKFFTDNSYNLDFPSIGKVNVEPPAPIKKYLVPKWYFRDSNWWPDFPTSADKMKWFFEAEGGQKNVDGVIAFTPDVIENLLGVLGEVDVDGLKFTKQNFWEQLEYQVEFGYYKQGIKNADRKDIIKDLGEIMISRLTSLPMNQWPSVFDLFNKEMAEKQILFRFTDAKWQALADAKDWTGRVKSFAGDYLMLVDSNLAALKTDSVMSRTLNYSLNNGVSTAAVDYQNLGAYTWATSKYRTYTRLYVPTGSELISINVGGQEIPKTQVDIYNEFGKTAFGVFFEVVPQTSKTVAWKYKLPSGIVNDKYQLLVQKQPGVADINLRLNIKLPKDTVQKAESLRRDTVFK